ncbi:uncharacterized protein [Canis lupus baileyi]|uniref:uncharacterized protein n=1 Tax=Canis lupus baileyi TaxID=143281 RepID=UPI003B96A51C
MAWRAQAATVVVVVVGVSPGDGCQYEKLHWLKASRHLRAVFIGEPTVKLQCVPGRREAFFQAVTKGCRLLIKALPDLTQSSQGPLAAPASQRRRRKVWRRHTSILMTPGRPGTHRFCSRCTFVEIGHCATAHEEVGRRGVLAGGHCSVVRAAHPCEGKCELRWSRASLPGACGNSSVFYQDLRKFFLDVPWKRHPKGQALRHRK